jgi:hypothetical protein
MTAIPVLVVGAGTARRALEIVRVSLSEGQQLSGCDGGRIDGSGATGAAGTTGDDPRGSGRHLVHARLARYREAGVTTLIVSPSGETPDDRLRTLRLLAEMAGVQRPSG